MLRTKVERAMRDPGIQAIVPGLFCWLLLATLDLSRVFSPADDWIGDRMFRLRGEHRISDSIALVEADDTTLAAFRWPLPRENYALILKAACDAGARAVGFDLLFTDEDPERAQWDAFLAAWTDSFPMAVHAVAFDANPGTPQKPLPRGSADLLRARGLTAPTAPAAVARSALVPYPALLGAARHIGHVTLAVDRGGATRRAPLYMRYGDRIYPALSLALLETAEGWTARSVSAPNSRTLQVAWSDGTSITFPVDDEGATAIDFAGDRKAVGNRYSMLRVLRCFRDHDRIRLERMFRGRIVLVGNTAASAADTGPTPFAAATPLVYVHANLLDALLRHSFLRPLPVWIPLLFTALLALALAWGCATVRLPAAGAMTASAVVGVGAIELGLFTRLHFQSAWTGPLLLPLFVYFAGGTSRIAMLERRRRERERELEIARSIQRRLLPAAPPFIEELDLFGINLPAREVGGDYYDWVPLDGGRIGLLVADVSGKGISAALLMSHLRAAVHAEARRPNDLGLLTGTVSASLYHAIDPGKFATFLIASVSPNHDRLGYCNAGHNPGLLVHAGRIQRLEVTSSPLGVLDRIECAEKEVRFARGDLLVLYSDGITEARGNGTIFGEERLEGLVCMLGRSAVPAEEVGRAILAEVSRFCGGDRYDDDVTLVVARRR